MEQFQCRPKIFDVLVFEEHTHDDWFGGKVAFDDAVKARFGDLVPQAKGK